MKAIDTEIDEKPTKAKVKELAELRIRNLQAFRELEELNNNGRFLNVHPLVKQYSLHQELKDLLKRNPSKFLEEYGKCQEYIKRYRSYCNNNKRKKDSDQHNRDLANLKKYQERRELMEKILSEQNKG
ncbi:MAG: hypothetical protein ACOC59_00235 [Bacteroidota bacterium]